MLCCMKFWVIDGKYDEALDGLNRMDAFEDYLFLPPPPNSMYVFCMYIKINKEV